MVAPVAYSRLNAYTDWSANNPGEPHPGQDFEEDFDALAAWSADLLAHQALLQREDGGLANGVIDSEDQFDPDFLLQFRASIATLGLSGIQGPAGPQGVVGPVGGAGPQGPPLPWIVSTGVPSAQIGITQQLFLNADNGDVYQKSNVGWLLITNIRGPGGGGGGGGSSDHGTLSGLSDPDHPISAVQGLQTMLDNLQTGLAALGVSQRNVYSQPSAPTSNLNAGDLWFDTDNADRLYRWSGASWVDVADKRLDTALVNASAAITAAAGAQATADGKVTTYYGSTTPASPRAGDLWIRADQNNKLYRYRTVPSALWVDVQDQGIVSAIVAAADAQSTADGKIESYYQPIAPIGASLGDIWVDTDAQNHPYRFNGAQWVSIRDASIEQAASAAASAIAAITALQGEVDAISDGVVEVFYAASAPGGAGTGDLWINTTLANQLHRYNGSSWVSVQDLSIQTALTDAALAQATADGKIRAFYQTTAPSSGVSTGDLWYDTDDTNRPYRYNGSSWVDISYITGIAGGLITGVSILNGSVTAVKMATGTITAASGVIANAAITNAMIADAAITTAKIGNLQVGTAQLQDASITTAKLGSVSITSAQIQDAAITNAKITNLTIGTEKFQNSSITQSASARATSTISSVTTAQTVLSASITSTGGRLYIWWGCSLRVSATGNYTGSTQATVRLKRGATVLQTYSETAEDACISPATLLFDETLPAGSYTYDIEVEMAGTYVGTARTRQILIMELKK